MSETTVSEDIPSTNEGSDVDSPIYLTEEDQEWSTRQLENKELSTLYTENTDPKSMSTLPGNVSTIGEEISAAEAMNMADNVDPTNSCVSQPDNTKINDTLATSEAIDGNARPVDKLKDSTEDNSASGANEDVSVPFVDASDPNDTAEEPTSNIKHSDTMASLDGTINPDSGDVENEEHVYEDVNGILDKANNAPDTREPQDPHNRVLTNPMYEADVGQQQAADSNNDEHEQEDTHDAQDPQNRVLTNPMYQADVSQQQAADNTSDEHKLQDSTAADSKDCKKLKKLQSQPTLKAQQPNQLCGPYHPNHWAGGLVTQQTDIGSIITFGGHGKAWKKGRNYGRFSYVNGLAVSSTNEIFVCDFWNKRIQVFSMKGVFLRSFPTDMKPEAIAIDREDKLWILLSVDKEGNIFITDVKNNKVLKYDKNGTYICSFGHNHLNSPTAISVDSLGRIIVADNGNNRVEMFRAEGEYIGTVANIRSPHRVPVLLCHSNHNGCLEAPILSCIAFPRVFSPKANVHSQHIWGSDGWSSETPSPMCWGPQDKGELHRLWRDHVGIRPRYAGRGA
ncbi:hypothetical protein Bbelb_194300 [Branchiostoma belcheri]|nr:hypothetical protein Bbelb_194300 [Branchiostoma belcheri]